MEKNVYWLYIFIFVGCYITFMYTALAMSFSHTYELPTNSPGVLTSERWSFEFVRELLVGLYLLNLISVFAMLVYKTPNGRWINIASSFLLFVMFVVLFTYDIIALSNGQVAASVEGFVAANQARDDQWCCVYGGTPGTELICSVNTTNVSCGPVSPDQLTGNGVFLTKIIVHGFIGILLLWNFFYSWSISTEATKKPKSK